jgi:hypothetical protein
MKRYMMILAAMLFGLASCEEKPWLEDVEKKLADEIRGVYEITSMTWLGDPVDLDGDGKASTDVLDELMRLPNLKDIDIPPSEVQFEWTDYWPAKRHLIRAWLPLQWLQRNRADDDYDLDALKGKPYSFEGAYTVSVDGGIEFLTHFHAYANREEWRFPDIYETGISALWTQTGYGQLQLKVHYAFHDHISDQMVKNEVIVEFRRIQYR